MPSIDPMAGFEDELSALVVDMFREDPLGAVVRVHLRFENLLSRWLDEVVPHPQYAKNLSKTFASKVELALSLGLHARMGAPLKRINRLRNDFAHKLDTQIDKQVVSDIYTAFNEEDKSLLQKMLSNMKKDLPAEASVSFTGLDPVDQFRLAAAALWAILRVALANRVYEKEIARLEGQLKEKPVCD